MLLFLNGVAGSEVIIILLFVLIFFGAKSIPGISRSLGKGIRQIKDASQEIQTEITKSGQSMKNDLNIQRSIQDIGDDISRPMRKMAKDMEDGITGRNAKKPAPKQFIPPKPIDQPSSQPLDQPQESSSNNDTNPAT